MCLFCKIANHEIPADIVYEDEHVLAFLDINPSSQGHTLIIPKKHYDDFTQVSSQLVARIHGVSKILVKRYDRVLNPQGYNLLSNAKSIAGQSVFHVHFHLIPRYESGDGLELHFHPNAQSKLSIETKKKIVL
jgi:histidine triad (HIT) family protein